MGDGAGVMDRLCSTARRAGAKDAPVAPGSQRAVEVHRRLARFVHHIDPAAPKRDAAGAGCSKPTSNPLSAPWATTPRPGSSARRCWWVRRTESSATSSGTLTLVRCTALAATAMASVPVAPQASARPITVCAGVVASKPRRVTDSRGTAPAGAPARRQCTGREDRHADATWSARGPRGILGPDTCSGVGATPNRR